jgi:hypothetical protein
MFDGAYIDPFKLSADSLSRLVNFATAAIAPAAIEDSMGSALSKGAAMAKAFIADRFIVPEGADGPKKSLYDAIPRSAVKTMADMRRKVKVRHKDVTMDWMVR